jgi:hypothetical protein
MPEADSLRRARQFVRWGQKALPGLEGAEDKRGQDDKLRANPANVWLFTENGKVAKLGKCLAIYPKCQH